MSSSNSSCPGALCPPAGQTANFNAPADPVRKAWIAALVVELAVPMLLLPARLYARCWLNRIWTLTDWVLITATLLFIAEIGIGFSLLDFGVGQHGWNLTASTFSKFSEILNIQQVIYQPAIGLMKCAIMLQLIEIFVPQRTGPRFWILIGFIVFNFVYFTIMFFLELFECSPRARIWNPSIPGKCIDIEATFIATSVVNVVEDFSILISPLRWTFELNATWIRKLKIASVFAVGLFACVCSVMRLAETVIHISDPDITVALLPVSLWSTAEVSAGLVVACMPYIPKIIEHPPLLKGTRLWELTGMSLLKSLQLSTDSSRSTSIEKAGKAKWNSEGISARSSTETGSSNIGRLPHSGIRTHSSNITQTFEVDQYSTPRTPAN